MARPWARSVARFARVAPEAVFTARNRYETPPNCNGLANCTTQAELVSVGGVTGSRGVMEGASSESGKTEAGSVMEGVSCESTTAKASMSTSTSDPTTSGKRPAQPSPSEDMKRAKVPPGVDGAPVDEIVAAAPRLAAAIREPGKCVKVAEKMASLLEEGKVKLINATAVFEVLSAAMEDAKRLKDPKLRGAYRRLYRAATERASLFPSHQQHQLRLWQLRVVTQIELHNNDPEHFARAVKEVRL